MAEGDGADEHLPFVFCFCSIYCLRDNNIVRSLCLKGCAFLILIVLITTKVFIKLIEKAAIASKFAFTIEIRHFCSASKISRVRIVRCVSTSCSSPDWTDLMREIDMLLSFKIDGLNDCVTGMLLNVFDWSIEEVTS